MNNNNGKKIYTYILVILGVWLLFVLLPFVFKLFANKFKVIEYNDLDMAYVAASALFTAVAFCVSLYILFLQRKDVVSKTNQDFFINVLDKVKNDPLFNQSRNYIFSERFRNDYKTLQKTNGNNAITLDDFKKLQNKKTIILYPYEDIIPEETATLPPYEFIRYFCDKMDFIGITVKQQYIDTAIFDYYGGVIIRSHKILEPLLIESRKQGNRARFIHYTYLYNAALNRKKGFAKDFDNMIIQFKKDKRKRDRLSKQ
jgi:hypothetical protein